MQTLKQIVLRICHFFIYAFLFISKWMYYRRQRLVNTVRYAIMYAANGASNTQLI